MLQEFMLRQMLRKAGAPEPVITKAIEGIKKDPDFFKKLAEEIEVKTKAGVPQQQAAMEVISNYQDKLKELLT